LGEWVKYAIRFIQGLRHRKFWKRNRQRPPPVRGIIVDDAVKWCNLKSEVENLVPVYTIKGAAANQATSHRRSIRKPTDTASTEIEWEWAARGGVSAKSSTYSGSNELDAIAWYSGNSPEGEPHAAGGKLPNELGLQDMSGNAPRVVLGTRYKNYRRFAAEASRMNRLPARPQPVISTFPKNLPITPVSGRPEILKNSFLIAVVLDRAGFRNGATRTPTRSQNRERARDRENGGNSGDNLTRDSRIHKQRRLFRNSCNGFFARSQH
jgi:hypothetical protein